jgi:hypothetical protein
VNEPVNSPPPDPAYIEKEGYRIKRYAPPAPPNELQGYLALLQDFEKRFFNNVDRGYEVMAKSGPELDGYIATQAELFASATGAERNRAGRMLAIAELKRGLDNAQEHISLRLEKGAAADPKRLEELQEKIFAEFTSARDEKFPTLLRTRGGTDPDGVVQEMVGEPYKMFLATLDPTPHTTEFFFDDRYQKVAHAMKCIDSVPKIMEPFKALESYRREGIQESLEKLATLAKERIQLQRSDPASMRWMWSLASFAPPYTPRRMKQAWRAAPIFLPTMPIPKPSRRWWRIRCARPSNLSMTLR